MHATSLTIPQTLTRPKTSMGNCIRTESAMQWAGDDWGSPAPEPLFSGDTCRERPYRARKIAEEESLLINEKGGGDSHFPSPAPPPAAAMEVKIKITKKQLEELLGRIDVQGLSVQQLLTRLIRVSDQGFEAHQRSWRPALKSIPEVN